MSMMRRRHIILATDLSARCDRAFERAVLLTREWDAQLIVVHALENEQLGRAASPRWHGIDRDRLDAETQISADLQRAGVAADVVVQRGSASEVIAELARNRPCDLIVTGIARELGLARAILGSTLEALARESVAPVLTVNRPARGSYDSAVVGTNFSKGSRAAVQATLQLFQPAQVTALHAYRLTGDRLGGMQINDEAAYLHLLGECRQFVADAAPATWQKVRCLAEIGFPETLLKLYALDRKVDLIAVGLEPRIPVATFLLGSTGRSLILSSPCDLLLVPAKWASSAGDAIDVPHRSPKRAIGASQVERHEDSVAVNAQNWRPARHQEALKTNTRH
jgi:nucleotide-binding universal stress UspA family protein